MEDTQKAFEQLTLIREMLEAGRSSLKNRGGFYVLWGGMSVLGTGLSYLLAYLGLPWAIGLLWLGLWGLGALGTRALLRRQPTGVSEQTWADKAVGKLWLGYAIISALGGVLQIPLAGGDWQTAMTGIFSTMAALTALIYWAVGTLLEERWLKNLSWCWCSLLLPINLVPGIYGPLIFGAGILFFEFVPGLVLLRGRRPRS